MMRRNIESWVIKSKQVMTYILEGIARMNDRGIQLDPLTIHHFLGHPTRGNLDISWVLFKRFYNMILMRSKRGTSSQCVSTLFHCTNSSLHMFHTRFLGVLTHKIQQGLWYIKLNRDRSRPVDQQGSFPLHPIRRDQH